MSIPVELQSLESVITRYHFAYLMTNSDKGPPHVVQAAVALDGGNLVINQVGRRTRANALARPDVGLVWPPESETDYSLIVDGQAALLGESLRITPTRAVLHRSSPSPEPKAPGGCGSDCVELGLTSH
ncbi:hypothetical protein [Paracandidimonas soli]|uniref:hypothetical protein n=1 Tax=Paracandidimonas soli TaxID=1917182 RepID=UPI00333F2A05